MTKFRLAIIGAAFLALIGLAGLNYYLNLNGAQRNASVDLDPSKLPGGAFTLTDQNGQVVTEAALNGKWTAVFFGYTYCPDFCPLTLQALAQVQTQLGGKAKDFQIVFISVDPARDTPASLKAYLDSGGMPKGAIGLTGTPDQVASVVKAYRTTASKVGEGDAYTYQHTTAVYLMDPRGRYNSSYAYGLSPAEMAGMIKDAMAGK
ncbi:SCO1/SenC family protein [Asticcacaulis biprosthecium C19]|uniref:SCO1/SenC family protein n=1 Tax=Asticcacaulis biprosthecium C19 TaxID=715226 RepID=F4QKW6_9CAUL|nr:SCO family protein [Asticcacaulis biprosthecium]EGF92189.1 SCO1/SenC family protein [Asticcacaulis biprosthecium C19]